MEALQMEILFLGWCIGFSFGIAAMVVKMELRNRRKPFQREQRLVNSHRVVKDDKIIAKSWADYFEHRKNTAPDSFILFRRELSQFTQQYPNESRVVTADNLQEALTEI